MGRVGRGLVVAAAGLAAHVADHVGERLPFDELHGVEVHAALGADGVNRHNVRVMQLGGGLGLIAEALQVFGVERGGERQHLERDAPSQRELHGLVDDAHAAAADFAHDLEVAQRICGKRLGRFGKRTWTSRRGWFTQGGFVDQVQTIQALCERLRQVRVATQNIVAAGSFARFQFRKVFLHGLHEPGIVGQFSGVRRSIGRCVHATSPKTCRSRASARSQSFSTLSCVRSMRSATWGKVSPSRCRRTITSR